jgi:hypothetical protein
MPFRPACLAACAAVALIALAAAPSHAVVYTFDAPVVTGPMQAPGVWYTDRYAPASFTNGVLGAENVLVQMIDQDDSAANRPGSFSSTFYNTQGRKLDAPALTALASIDLYVAGSYTSLENRAAGFWATGVDGSNAITAYPIVEYTTGPNDLLTNPNDTIVGNRFRAYNVILGEWESLAAVTTTDVWYTLNIALDAANDLITYSVGANSWSVTANGTQRLDNVILQGHNNFPYANFAGPSYSIAWDNLTLAAVPEATSLAFGALVCGVLGVKFGAGKFRSRKTA